MDSGPGTARRIGATQRHLQHASRFYRMTLMQMQRRCTAWLDLGIRLWLAQLFFISGLLKVANWDNALALARYEYPVSWLDPVSAAYLGAGIELIAPLLLAIGLATRAAALSLWLLTLVVQIEYQAVEVQLFWLVLLGGLVVRGADRLSLDHTVTRGLTDSALPFAATIIRSLQRVAVVAEPLYLLGMRLWIALALMFAVGSTPSHAWLPLQTVAPMAEWHNSLVLLLCLGLGLRPVALLLFGLCCGSGMLDAAGQSNALYLAVLLADLVLRGAGPLSIDRLILLGLSRHNLAWLETPDFEAAGLPRIVIIGAGFGGLACAQGLRTAAASITLIDRHNYHLFQPLLYQVATTALAAGDIAIPIRSLLREQRNTRVLLGEVTGIDCARREVILETQRIAYDYLVIATGSSHSYFGRDEWEPYAPGLKRIEDAIAVRSRLLLAFERAEACADPVERAALLTFLVVGGGPTGVELAGAIAELARVGMTQEFRNFDPAQARVLLVQAGPRILPTFPETLSQTATRELERLKVEVLTDSRVEQIDAGGVRVSGTQIMARTVFWAAGVVASPVAKWLGIECDASGRVKVEADLSIRGLPEVFAVGDTALSLAWNGKPVPGLGPAAKQGGNYVARVLRARIAQRSAPTQFRYRHLGSLATIGRKAAVADFGKLRLSGAAAWWLWGLVHVYFLAGTRNRISIVLDWIWAYFTFRSSTRLITGTPQPPVAQETVQWRTRHGS